MTERSIGSEAANDGRAESDPDEAERLHVKQEQPQPKQRRSGHWRAPLAITAITLGCVLAPVAVIGYWASNEVTNTDRYVQNMAPLISEPAVQGAMAAKITAAITGQLDINARTSSVATELSQHGLTRLSTLVSGLSGPITTGVDQAVQSAVARTVASPAMATIWTQANRAAHAAVVKVLSGQGGDTANLDNGKVTISLGPFITKAEQNLAADGLSFATKLPPVNPTFTLFSAPNLEKAQTGYRLVSALKWVLPFLAFGLMAVGIFVARRPRRAFAGAGLGLAASMLVLAAALAIARGIYLRSVPSSTLPSAAAAALYDTLVRFIRDGLRILMVVGLVVAIGAYLTGNAAGAVRIRRTVSGWIGRLGARGPSTGPVGGWMGAHKRGLRAGAVVVAALIFVFTLPPSMALLIWLLVLLLLALGLIELLGGRGGSQATQAPAPPAPRTPA